MRRLGSIGARRRLKRPGKSFGWLALAACLCAVFAQSPSMLPPRPPRSPRPRPLPAVLFAEPFEDTNFATRGWYDGGNPGGTLSSDEHILGSSRSFECRFMPGGTGCSGGTPRRHLFTETESVYIGFWVKHSANWMGSGKPYHPHFIYLLTNKNAAYSGLAWTHLTTYVEENGGRPVLSIQDGQNIVLDSIGTDLAGVAEQRAVAGCNGDSDGYGNGDCYRCAPNYCNGKVWRTGDIHFSGSPGPYYKGDWHHVEAFFRLNSVSGGVGLKDGVLQYWYDGVLLIDTRDAILRTGQFPDMKFNQFVLAPYIGDGSPVDQTIWVDNLVVAAGRQVLPGQDLMAESRTGPRRVIPRQCGSPLWTPFEPLRLEEAIAQYHVTPRSPAAVRGGCPETPLVQF